MPYIAEIERPKFAPSVEMVLGILNDPNDNPYLKGEFFGFFVNRLVRRFLSSADYTHAAFNSTFFNESKKKSLENSADSIAAMLPRADPMSAAGDLNYCISAVYWGVLGDADGHADAKYGMRAYLNGAINKVIKQLAVSNVTMGNQKDATMAFRREIVIDGVLDHIKHETYLRKTTVYEQKKIEENGDVWQHGKLV